MSLFDRPLAELRRYLDSCVQQGEARSLRPAAELPWASGPVVVLSDETRLELGNPSVASCSMVLWASSDEVVDQRITLVGPDFCDGSEPSLPFAQVVIVAGRIDDQPQCFRDLREAVYGLRLTGVSTRNHPATQRVWYRVGSDAIELGFDAAMLSSALMERAQALPFVERAEVLLVTASREEVRRLTPTAELASDIGSALIKMADEMSFDCDSCDYTDICDQIDELRRKRDRLRQEEHK